MNNIHQKFDKPGTSPDSQKEKDTGAPKDSGKGIQQTTVLRFTYDGDGNRIGKSVIRNKKTDTTQYLWDINHGLPQVLTESDGKGTALYTYGLGRISMADPHKAQMYYQYDGLGSVRGLTDRKGMTKGLYAYDAFGKPLISASPVDNDFQYTGEQVDDETGLIYLRSRYYDPEIGRFISRDSFAGFDTNTQSLNRYTYVQNNPVVYTDPSGKVAWWVAPAIIGGVFGGAIQYYSDYQANTAAGKTGVAQFMPSSSPVNYGISIAGGVGTGLLGAYAATAVGMGVTLNFLTKPAMIVASSHVGSTATNIVKNYVNGAPFDKTTVETSARSSTIVRVGVGASTFSQQYSDNAFSGGPKLANVGKLY